MPKPGSAGAGASGDRQNNEQEDKGQGTLRLFHSVNVHAAVSYLPRKEERPFCRTETAPESAFAFG
jgi:hypothetical protein